MRRLTIRQMTQITGLGIHSGDPVTLKCLPAPVGTGLEFRTPRRNDGTIQVSPFNVVETVNAVTLANRNWRIQTVEHLLAALAGLGVTDLIMEIDAQEIPIMDGSALPFMQALEDAGLQELDAFIEPISITNPVWVVDGDKYLVALPADTYRATYSIDFDHPLLRGQSISIDLSPENLREQILHARTFGFLRDVEAMKARGLIRGASLDNAVVLTEDGFMNESLRYPDECVRHKVLDLVGDLYLLGRPLNAHIIASRAGHALDVALARKIQTQAAMDELASLRKDRMRLVATTAP